MSQAKRIVHCPQCNFTFDITYGRTFACSGCPSIVQCGMARCPKCGHEFPLPGAYGDLYSSINRKYKKQVGENSQTRAHMLGARQYLQ